MCMIHDCDEGFEVCSTEHRKARKQHQCDECGREIMPGETYETFKGMLCGSWSTFKTCSHCQAVRKWLDQVCSGWVFCAVGDDLREHFHDGYGIWLGRAAVGMRRKWRRRDGELMPPMTLPANIDEIRA